MQGLQIHSAEQSHAFFARPSKLAFVRCEPIRDPDGTFRKGLDLLFYCPERDQIFLVLDYQKYPYEVLRYASLPERPGLTQIEPTPFPLELTRERLIPALWHYGATVHHLKRYRFARENLQPGSVLDCACGVGYGTHMMLQRNDISNAVGVDISEFAVSFSRRLVKDARARFCTTLPDETFDNIVCFETLEHIPDPYRFMEDLVRRLSPGGRLILSVPQERYDGSQFTSFHVSNWNCRRLENFVSLFCRDVQIHYQVASGLGPDTFSASEIRSESWGEDKNEYLLAILRRPAVRRKERIVVRRKTGLREVLWAGPIVEELKCRNPEKDILVVTGRTEVFIDNPHADMVLTPAWIGEVNVDLDPVHENSTRDRLLEAYRQAAGVKDSPARARVYPSSSERQFVEGTLAAHGKRMIACHPAASPAVSSWPAEQWAELVRRLQAEHTVVLLGERGSHEFSAPGVLSFIGKELPLSLIAAFLSKAELLVSPQHSELSEIAAAVETPVVLLCGTAVPEAQLRFTEQFALVRSPFDCVACVSDGAGASPPPICVYGMGEGRCMKAITVEMVMKGIAEALRRRSPARGVAT